MRRRGDVYGADSHARKPSLADPLARTVTGHTEYHPSSGPLGPIISYGARRTDYPISNTPQAIEVATSVIETDRRY